MHLRDGQVNRGAKGSMDGWAPESRWMLQRELAAVASCARRNFGFSQQLQCFQATHTSTSRTKEALFGPKRLCGSRDGYCDWSKPCCCLFVWSTGSLGQARGGGGVFRAKEVWWESLRGSRGSKQRQLHQAIRTCEWAALLSESPRRRLAFRSTFC